MAASPPVDDLSVLLSLQDAKGSFAAHPKIESICASRRVDFAALHRHSSSHPSSATTLIVMQLLRRAFAADRSLWRRAYDKAARAMAKSLGTDTAGIERILDDIWRHYEKDARLP